jgi:hypothetical protein
MMAAAGWMISISSMGVYTAAACGGFWGSLVFPRLVRTTSYAPPLAIRIVAPLFLFVAGGYWLIHPMLPDRALTNARVEVIRRNSPGEPPLKLDYLGSEFTGSVREANMYASVSRLEFTTNSKNQVRALLIVDDPQLVSHTFALPRTGTVVYRQSHWVWQEERTGGGKPSDISVTLTAFNSTLQVQGPCCSSESSGFAPYR